MRSILLKVLNMVIGWGSDAQMIGCLKIWDMSKKLKEKRRLGK